MVRFDPANSAFFAITIAAAGLAQITSTPLVLVTAGWIVALSAIWVSRTAFDFLTSSIEQARIYNSNPAPTCLIDTYFKIRRANDAFSVLLGLEKSEVMGKLCWLIMPGPSCATSKCPMLRILDGESPVEMEEDREARDGQVLACSIQASPFHDKEGKITGIIVTVHDVSERKRLERHLAHSATHDPLTDLPNRTLFLDRLSQAIARAKRTGQRLATIFIDLDRFKEINDTLGHEAGDRLLQEIALRIQSILRTTDSVARLGGDEFLVLVNEISTVDNAVEIARKIMEAIRLPVILGGSAAGVEASIGIAVYPEDGEEGLALIRHADLAMYDAKKSDGHPIRRYLPIAKSIPPEREASSGI